MFRHKNHLEEEKKTKEAPVIDDKVEIEKNDEVGGKASSHVIGKDSRPEALRELLEKNLKWSQIIYEQNRRINSKLFWQAFAGWLRIFIIVVPIILAAVYLTPFLSGAWQQYQSILGQVSDMPKDANSSVEKLLKLLPLDPAKQEQLKTMLK